MMEDFTPAAIEIAAEAVVFEWSEVLGVSVNADVSTIQRAMLRLVALCHPDKDGQSEQIVRINTAYEQALDATSIIDTRNRLSAEGGQIERASRNRMSSVESRMNKGTQNREHSLRWQAI